jgi:hypothetical protein
MLRYTYNACLVAVSFQHVMHIRSGAHIGSNSELQLEAKTLSSILSVQLTACIVIYVPLRILQQGICSYGSEAP